MFDEDELATMLTVRFPGGEAVAINPIDDCVPPDVRDVWAVHYEMAAAARQAVSGPMTVRVAIVQATVFADTLFHVEVQVDVGPNEWGCTHGFGLSWHSEDSVPFAERPANVCERASDLLVELHAAARSLTSSDVELELASDQASSHWVEVLERWFGVAGELSGGWLDWRRVLVLRRDPLALHISLIRAWPPPGRTAWEVSVVVQGLELRSAPKCSLRGARAFIEALASATGELLASDQTQA